MRSVRTVIVIGLIMAASALMPAYAQDQRDREKDVFTVAGIEVDVTAKSASAARKQAFDNARRKAFEKLLGRLVGENEVARIDLPSLQKIGGFIKNYGIDNEQVSKVRYKAQYGFTFNREAVRNFLSSRGITYSETKGAPLLVLPFFQQGTQLNLWRGYNPWLSVWSDAPVLDGLLPLEIPIGDLSDVRRINGDNALTYGPEDLQKMLDRYEAREAVLLIAAFNEGPPPQSLDAPAYTPLTIYIYRTDNKAPQFVRSLFLRPDSGASLRDLLKRGMREVAGFLRKDWKQQTAVQPGQREKIEAVVRFSGLAEWLAMQKRLRTLGGVDSLDIRSLSADRARLALGYRGTMRQFGRTLRREGLQASTFYPGRRGRYNSGGEHNPVMNIRKDNGDARRQNIRRPQQPRQLQRNRQDRRRDNGRGRRRSNDPAQQPRVRPQQPGGASGYSDHNSGYQGYGQGYQ